MLKPPSGLRSQQGKSPLLVADAELFRPAADAAACSRRLQSRQRAFADDIALELSLLQFPAKR